MAPGLSPLLGRLSDILQRFAESVSGGLVILLVENGFGHAEIGERSIGLNGEGALVFADGVVVATILGKLFATGDCRAGAQSGAALENDVVGIDLDTAGFGAAEGFDGEGGFGAGDIDGLGFRIAFGVDAQIDGHMESVEGLLDFADDTEALVSAVDNVFDSEVGHTGG